MADDAGCWRCAHVQGVFGNRDLRCGDHDGRTMRSIQSRTHDQDAACVAAAPLGWYRPLWINPLPEPQRVSFAKGRCDGCGGQFTSHALVFNRAMSVLCPECRGEHTKPIAQQQVTGSQPADPSTWSAPLLPPDPDAWGSLHWLQHLSGHVRLGRWGKEDGGWSWADGRSCFEPDGWRYHSQVTVPAPLAAPDPDADRMWAATKGLSG